jgi:hypothetical protein
MRPPFDAFFEVIAPLPDVLLVAGLVLAAACVVLALAMLWRARRRAGAARLDDLWRAALALVFAPLPWLAARQIFERRELLDKLPSLGIAALWLLLALPALLAAPSRGKVRWSVLVSLAISDAAAGALLVYGLSDGRAALSLWPLAAFAVLLHAAAFAHVLPRGAALRGWRWALFLAAAFLTAGFFAPPATRLEARQPPASVARVAPSRPARFHEAWLSHDGERAWALDRPGGKLYEVNLADGSVRAPLPADTRPIAALAVSPDRKLLALAHVRGSALRLQTLDSAGRPRTAFHGGSEFEVRTVLVGERYVIAAGEGDGVNYLQCPVAPDDAEPNAAVERRCRELRAPLPRIGGLTATPLQALVFAAEGDKWLARGWRLLTIGTEDGTLARRAGVGAGLGRAAFDSREQLLYVARPDLGGVETLTRDELTRRDWIKLEPGVDWPTIDRQRDWLLTVSQRNGYFLAYDLKRRRMASRTPIGAGVTCLDALPEQGLALICAARGLVVLRLDELAGLTAER